MSNKEVKEFSEKLRNGLKLAEKRMLEDKAFRGEDIIVSSDGETFQRIPAKQIMAGKNGYMYDGKFWYEVAPSEFAEMK